MNFANVIKILYPLAQAPEDYAYFMSSAGKSTLYWNAAKLGPRPTPEFLAQKAVELAPQLAAIEFAEKRRAAYNKTWTQDEFQEAVLEGGAKMQDLLAKRAAVRGALPKPKEMLP